VRNLGGGSGEESIQEVDYTQTVLGENLESESDTGNDQAVGSFIDIQVFMDKREFLSGCT
jgi:hypothetical protein